MILDEPANGLDPEGVRWLRDFLRRLATEGRTVLVSSHVLAEVAQTVDQVLIISRGRLVIESSLAELTARAGGAVRVRSARPRPARRSAPRQRSAGHDGTDRALLVNGGSSEQVGEIAFGAGVPVHELLTDGGSLEEIFLESHLRGAGMIAQIKAELLKIRSTRTTIGLLLGMVALILLFTLLTGLLSHPPG